MARFRLPILFVGETGLPTGRQRRPLQALQ